MIGRKVKSDWHRMTGEVIRWDPLGASMCDVLVREDSGRVCWYSDSDLQPADGLGPLSRRDVAREWARLIALDDLRAIRARHVQEFDRPWPGLEHGKALFGRMVNGVIEDLEKKG